MCTCAAVSVRLFHVFNHLTCTPTSSEEIRTATLPPGEGGTWGSGGLPKVNDKGPGNCELVKCRPEDCLQTNEKCLKTILCILSCSSILHPKSRNDPKLFVGVAKCLFGFGHLHLLPFEGPHLQILDQGLVEGTKNIHDVNFYAALPNTPKNK